MTTVTGSFTDCPCRWRLSSTPCADHSHQRATINSVWECVSHTHYEAVIEDQRAPIPTEGFAVWDLVIEDMKQRDQIGFIRYGTRLQVDNGRDHLVDAYQEALDLVVYLRAEIEKRRETSHE